MLHKLLVCIAGGSIFLMKARPELAVIVRVEKEGRLSFSSVCSDHRQRRFCSKTATKCLQGRVVVPEVVTKMVLAFFVSALVVMLHFQIGGFS